MRNSKSEGAGSRGVTEVITMLNDKPLENRIYW